MAVQIDYSDLRYAQAAVEYGSVPDFLDKHGYGPEDKNPRSEADRRRSENKRGRVAR